MTDTPTQARQASDPVPENATEAKRRAPKSPDAKRKVTAGRGRKARKNKPAETQSDAVAAPSEPAGTFDLSSTELYLNRELTWLDFNKRVLHEAQDSRTPPLERLKFLAIVGSNLDEFLMKRIGGLKQQVGASVHKLTVDGRTPQQQIRECTEVIRELTAAMRVTFQDVRTELRKHLFDESS